MLSGAIVSHLLDICLSSRCYWQWSEDRKKSKRISNMKYLLQISVVGWRHQWTQGPAS